ncbi:hypothetical protein Q91_0935 [Cycloclasticus sp. P1]|nr:hypothetical protein Q91_0935 [Cycloclasticus sp. P1]
MFNAYNYSDVGQENKKKETLLKQVLLLSIYTIKLVEKAG